MVGMAPPALVLRAMESAVQKFVQRPGHCAKTTQRASLNIASFALIEYLEGVLAGKPVSPGLVSPSTAMSRRLRVRIQFTTDLWPGVERRFREPDLEVTTSPLLYGADTSSS